MGHLDDIIKRNQAAGGNSAADLIDKLPERTAEPVPSQPFQLPSQRPRAVAVWKVLLLMLILGGFIGLKVWRDSARQAQADAHQGP